MKKCLLILCSVLMSGQAFGWGAIGQRSDFGPEIFATLG